MTDAEERAVRERCYGDLSLTYAALRYYLPELLDRAPMEPARREEVAGRLRDEAARLERVARWLDPITADPEAAR